MDVLLPQLFSPNLLLFKILGPSSSSLLGLIVKFLSLLGVSYFRFTLKMDVSRFMYALVSFGLSRGCLVYWSKKKRENLCSSELPFRRKNEPSCA